MEIRQTYFGKEDPKRRKTLYNKGTAVYEETDDCTFSEMLDSMIRSREAIKNVDEKRKGVHNERQD